MHFLSTRSKVIQFFVLTPAVVVPRPLTLPPVPLQRAAMPRALWLAVAAVLLGVWLVDPFWALNARDPLAEPAMANRRQAARLTRVVNTPSARDPP